MHLTRQGAWASVTVVAPPRIHSSAVSSSHGHQLATDSVHLHWAGFAPSNALVDHYEVRLVGTTPWTKVGLLQETVLQPLTLEEHKIYKAEVVSFDKAGVRSRSATASVWVDSTPPVVTGKGMCAD